MQKETVTFVGYKRIYNYIIAEFRRLSPEKNMDGSISDTLIMDKPSCELRLKNLKMSGGPHDQTALALKRWPAERLTGGKQQ